MSSDDFRPIAERERDNLHEVLVSRLRDYIVEGPLQPGERVPERHLCDLFEVSRTPLREALKVLAAEGVVELLPNRGARVRVFSHIDILEIFEVLAALESAAGRIACTRITDEEISTIEELHYAMYGFYMQRNLPDYFRLNQEIHDRIILAARNDTLLACYRSFTARIRQLRYLANSGRPDRWSEAMREHEGIIHALRNRQGNELAEILFHHLIHKAAAVCQTYNPSEEADDEA